MSSVSAPALAGLSNMFMFEHVNRTQGIAGVALIVALAIFSTSTALLHLTGRRRWTRRDRQLTSELGAARVALDRAETFLSAEPQIVVAWGSASGEPDIAGDLSLVMDAPVPRRVLGFGSWLPPDQAQEIERRVDRLRERGESFRLPVVSLGGRHLEADGRAIGGRAVMRIRDVSGDRLELTQLRERHARTLSDMDALRALLDANADPVWTRDPDGRLTWVNAAYARAVEANDARDAVARGVELLDRPAREEAMAARADGKAWRGRAPVVASGERRLFDIVDAPAPAGSAGMAKDATDIEKARRALTQQMQSHQRTLDELTTAVAIFDGKKQLVFHNAAYERLWSLDAAFLRGTPTDSEILERLRAERKLPEQADFRVWKAQLHELYKSNENSVQVWYLPDQRTLRAVIAPNPEGGVTYLFDDMSSTYKLRTQYEALVTVQEETLDALKEAVAVFGMDGRMKIANESFAAMWGMDAQALRASLVKDATPASKHAAGDAPMHIDTVIETCRSLCDDDAVWRELRSVVAGLHDARTGFARRIIRKDGGVLDCATAPLPDGATLVTFADVTAHVHIQRALTERNQALEDAQKLRNEFVHHVSYELRSPLTNIIGYVELLGDPAVGALNDKQREYAGHALKSSSALLSIINDILDLASIDNDALELTLEDVDIARIVATAGEGLQDRLAEADIRLQLVVTDGVGSFRADAKRLRQVLFNLLSNAIGFSAPGQTVTLAALRRDNEVVFKVSDQGRGIPADVLDHVFDRFQSNTVGSRHRGVGLGLSIVRSFVELHGGRVHIDSAAGEGTTVTCSFPADASLRSAHDGRPRAAQGAT